MTAIPLRAMHASLNVSQPYNSLQGTLQTAPLFTAAQIQLYAYGEAKRS